jgi:broad specificity phosphatase PhoE
LGIEQCKLLRDHLKQHEPLAAKIEAVISSPMRRTLQTAHVALSWLTEREKIKTVADANWQENSDNECDTGSPISAMMAAFPDVDFAGIDPMFPSKTGPYAFTRKAVVGRGQSALRALQARPEKVIAVVSHAGFLRCGVSNRHFHNADYRIFEIVDDDDGLVALRELQETEEKGGGMGWSWKGVAERKLEFPDDSDNAAIETAEGNIPQEEP